MDTIKRRIISREQWDNLSEKGMLELKGARFDKDYVITLMVDVMKKLVREKMENVFKLKVDLIVSISVGETWLKA